MSTFFILYATVPAFQSNANGVLGWIKNFRNWKRNWGWTVSLGVIGFLGLLYLLAIIAKAHVAGMVKREEIRTGRKLEQSPGIAGTGQATETR